MAKKEKIDWEIIRQEAESRSLVNLDDKLDLRAIPLFDRDPRSLITQAEDYFQHRITNFLPITIEGLAFHLGISIKDFKEQRKNSNDIGRVLHMLSDAVEASLANGVAVAGSRSGGMISMLKNDFDWTEKTVQVNEIGDLAALLIAARGRAGRNGEEKIIEPEEKRNNRRMQKLLN